MKKKKNVRLTLLMLTPLMLMVVLASWISIDWLLGDLTKDLPEETTQVQQETIEAILPSTQIDAQTTAEETQQQAVKKNITMSFVGDILLSDHVLGAYERGGGITGAVEDSLLQSLIKADIFMANEEFPFSNKGEMAKDKQFTFRLPPEKVTIFSELGIDIVTLANNHALDFGTEALLETFDTLDHAGIQYVGAGKDLDRAKELKIMESGGWRIGFLGASRVIPEVSWNASSNTPGMLTTYDTKILVQEIEKAKVQCDFLVVYVHWGEERNNQPVEYQQNFGKQYIDAGADLVIGSHPHVLQGIEYYEGKPIVYSLGNFIFGSSIPKTMVLTGELGVDGDLKLYLKPCTSLAGFTQEVKGNEKKEEFYRFMEGLSWGIEIENETGKVIPN